MDSRALRDIMHGLELRRNGSIAQIVVKNNQVSLVNANDGSLKKLSKKLSRNRIKSKSKSKKMNPTVSFQHLSTDQNRSKMH